MRTIAIAATRTHPQHILPHSGSRRSRFASRKRRWAVRGASPRAKRKGHKCPRGSRMGLKKGSKKEKKKEKKKPEPEPEPDPDESEEEDLMGDQSWAQSDPDAFSAGVDDMFADLFGADPSAAIEKNAAEMEAAGFDPNAKMSQMGEDVAAAEAEEAAQEAAAEAELAEQAEKEEKARIRKEKRANMTKEDKKAKVMCGQYKKKAAAAKEDGTLADEVKYGEALQLMEDDEWVQAEAALKESLGRDPQEDTRTVEEEADAKAVEEVEPTKCLEKKAAEEQAEEAARLAQKEEEEGAATEQARVEAEQAEQARVEAEQAEQARVEAEQAEQARVAAEQAEQARVEAEQAEQARVAAEQAEQ
eukprot:COSAG05_NODE_3590_length_1972_cov_105.107848_1_plen_359_part_10